jgi:protein-L-isoaspartate O-methyltransferase
MAWRSSGNSNEELVGNLKRFGIITSDVVEEGFLAVDRRLFVPKAYEQLAYSDQPLKEGNVHISAPHIYGAVLEALDLQPNSSQAFLSIGSGTGYLSAVAAEIMGPRSLNFGKNVCTLLTCITNVLQSSATTHRYTATSFLFLHAQRHTPTHLICSFGRH